MRIGLTYDHIYIITITITIYAQLKTPIYHVQTYQVPRYWLNQTKLS